MWKNYYWHNNRVVFQACISLGKSKLTIIDKIKLKKLKFFILFCISV